MAVNTINVSSWMILNALIPTALPDFVIQQYKNEFSTWPTLNQRDKGIQLNQLFLALKSLRSVCWENWFDHYVYLLEQR